jgi:hypothetical protein
MGNFITNHYTKNRNAVVENRTYLHSASSRETSNVEPRSEVIDLEDGEGTLSFVSGVHWEEDPSEPLSGTDCTEGTGRSSTGHSTKRSRTRSKKKVESTKFRELRIGCRVKAQETTSSTGGPKVRKAGGKSKAPLKPSPTVILPNEKIGAMKVHNMTEQPIIDFLAKTIPDFLLDNSMSKKGLEKMIGGLIKITYGFGKKVATIEGVQRAWAVVEKKYCGGYFDDEASSVHLSDNEIDLQHDAASGEQS